jgi:hypothetical protein
MKYLLLRHNIYRDITDMNCILTNVSWTYKRGHVYWGWELVKPVAGGSC